MSKSDRLCSSYGQKSDFVPFLSQAFRTVWHEKCVCFKVVPIDKMIFPHWKPTFGGLYQAFRSILSFSVQCDTLLENQISEVFLTINERIWTIPSKYVIPNMKPLQYSGFGHKKSFFCPETLNYPKTVQCDIYTSPFLEILMAWRWN